MSGDVSMVRKTQATKVGTVCTRPRVVLDKIGLRYPIYNMLLLVIDTTKIKEKMMKRKF